MKVLAENRGKVYCAIAIDRPSDVVSPFPGIVFPCMIWDHEGGFGEVQRTEVAKRLLEANCRYVVCGGLNSEEWHNVVDMEFVRQHLNDPVDTLDAVHVMTTGHEGESPDDVAFFFVLNTNFDEHNFERYLVLHVGDGKQKGEVDAAVRRYALGKEAV